VFPLEYLDSFFPFVSYQLLSKKMFTAFRFLLGHGPVHEQVLLLEKIQLSIIDSVMQTRPTKLLMWQLINEERGD
jgi:hypothetical protein